MSAVQAAPAGTMDACNQLGVPALKGAFPGFTGFTIFAAFLLNVIAVVAAFLPWSSFSFPNFYSINFGLKYFFILVDGAGSSFATGGGLLYADPYCSQFFGALAGVSTINFSDVSLYALGRNLCDVCDASNTWSYLWLSSTCSWWFFIFLCSYVACCKCLCCCNFGTYSRTALFLMGILTLAFTAGARGQNSACNSAIKAWADYMTASASLNALFPGMKLSTRGVGSDLGSACIALSVFMLLLTVIFPWPTGRFANEVDAGAAAAAAGLDTKPPAAPAYPGSAPAYPKM